MAEKKNYSIYSQGDKVEYGIKVFIVDTDADKKKLPIHSSKMGSKCYVIKDKKWYILNGSSEWDPFVDAGGSGSSESPFIPKGSVATVDELPTEGNEIGDLYVVQEDHSEWVWLTSEDYPDGNWEKLGPNTEVFTVTLTQNDNNEWVADKSVTSIIEAHQAGKICQMKTGSSDNFSIIPLVSIFIRSNTLKTCQFGGCIGNYTIGIVGTASSNDPDLWSVQTIALAEAPKEQIITGTSVSLTPETNCIYKCETLTSLTINNSPATGAYTIVFTSGATATSTTIPSTILGLEDFVAEANTMYEINVLDNRAVVGSWAVTV